MDVDRHKNRFRGGKVPALLLVVVLVSVSSAGCLDVEWLSKNLLPPVDDTTVYRDVYTNISHTFVTNDFDSLTFNKVFDIDVPPGSVHIDIRAEAQLDELPELPRELPIDVPDDFDFDRYVDLKLFNQDAELFYGKRYNDTTPLVEQWPKIPFPETGTWRLRVDAAGVGHPSIRYFDNFRIVVIVRVQEAV